MKITYVLLNKGQMENEIPAGQAWKWILHLEHEFEIDLIFQNLKQKISSGKLTLLNLQIDQQFSSDYFLNLACKAFNEPVIYDDFIPVSRIISTHTETDFSDQSNIAKRLSPFQKQSLKI